MSFWQRILDAAASLDERSYYELLGVEPSASGQQAAARFYELTRRIHPDRHARERDPARVMALTRVYARLNEAMRVLTDPAKRAAYDSGLAQGRRRLDADASPAAGPRETRDPRSVTARAMYERALALLDKGDVRAARGQLDLALQIEPDSRAIKAALERARPTESKPSAAAVAPASVPASVPEPSAPTTPALAESRAVPTAPAAARAHRRITMTRAIRIKLGSWQSFREVYSRDISRGGIMLESKQPIDAGTTVNLRIDLPTGEALELSAIAVRTVRRAGDGSVGVGLSFCEMSAETEARLKDLLAACERELAATAAAPVDAVPGLEEIVPLLARAKSEGPVSLLGLPAAPTAEDVQRAYDQLCARHDPSRFADADATVREAAFELVVLARVAYDRALAQLSSADADDAIVDPLPSLSVRPAREAPARPSAAAALPPRALLEGDALVDARALIVQRRFAEARALLEAALQAHPGQPRLLAAYYLASGLQAKAAGELDGARRYFASALRHDPQCAEAIAELRRDADRAEP